MPKKHTHTHIMWVMQHNPRIFPPTRHIYTLTKDIFIAAKKIQDLFLACVSVTIYLPILNLSVT